MKIKTRTSSNLEKVLSVRKLCFFLNNKFLCSNEEFHTKRIATRAM